MQNLGKRLEEARKARNLSLGDAAEATKIRADYLQSFERNEFDIPLPDIYRKGFVKLYARYLGADVDEVGKELKLIFERRAQQMARPEIRPGLGQMDIGSRGQAHRGDAHSEPSGSRFRFGRIPPIQRRSDDDRPETEIDSSPLGDEPFDKELYLKVGVAVVSAVAVLFLLFLLFSALFGGGSDAAEPTSSDPVTTSSSRETITVTAGNSVRIEVLNPETGQAYFNERLNPGEPQIIPVDGPPTVKFTDGSDLLIEFRGRAFRVNTPGRGQISAPRLE